MSPNVVYLFSIYHGEAISPKFGQLRSGHDDFTDSYQPIKTLEIFSINNNIY